jgi:hypothetical protein
MNEYYAKQALKELGITRPSRALIDAYMRADEANQKLEDQAELAEAQAKWDREVALAATGADHESNQSPYSLDKPALDKPIPPRPAVPSVLRPVKHPKPRSDGRKRGSSKSALAPALRGEGTLERKHRTGKRGRPRVIASWMPDVAQTMAADGLTLSEALSKHGINLDETQLRALQRNAAFKEMRQQARRNRRQQQPSRNLKNSSPDGG